MHRRPRHAVRLMANLGELLRSGKPTVGTWNQIAAPELIDLIGWNGFDYAIIDCEHGPFGIEAAERQGRACLAAGIAPALRVPANDPVWIGKALDAGVATLVIPNVSTQNEAARAVAATRYAPDGTRGACPCVRATGHFTADWPAHVARTEAETGVIALVESAEGVANIDAIVATEGLAALMIGPFDLAVSLGLSGDWRHPTVDAALTTMAAAAVSAKLPLIVPVFANEPAELADLIAAWRERGAASVVLGSDKIIIADALARWSQSARTAATLPGTDLSEAHR